MTERFSITKRSNPHFVERATEELEAAVEAAAGANRRWRDAEAKLAREYPGDHRLMTVKADWEPDKISFLERRREVSILQREAAVAEQAVHLLRARFASSASEADRRTELSKAIAASAEAEQAAGKIMASVDRAKSALSAAETRLADTSAAEDSARKGKADRFLEAIEADRSIEADTLREVRERKIEAADDVSVARDALTLVQGKLRVAEEVLRGARAQVLALAQNVLASAVPWLLEETQALHRELEGRRQILRFLGEHEDPNGAIDAYISDAVFPFELGGDAPEDHPAVLTWLESREALQREATAPLPTV